MSRSAYPLPYDDARRLAFNHNRHHHEGEWIAGIYRVSHTHPKGPILYTVTCPNCRSTKKPLQTDLVPNASIDCSTANRGSPEREETE